MVPLRFAFTIIYYFHLYVPMCLVFTIVYGKLICCHDYVMGVS